MRPSIVLVPSLIASGSNENLDPFGFDMNIIKNPFKLWLELNFFFSFFFSFFIILRND